MTTELDANSHLRRINPRWTEKGIVLCCERCGTERIQEEGNPDYQYFDLRVWLKDRLKDDGHWKSVRAVNTSCLDVCAKDCVTVSIVRNDGSTHSVILDPHTEREQLYREILSHLRLS